jgi:hypothetical protein
MALNEINIMKNRIKTTIIILAAFALAAPAACRAQSVADCIQQLTLDYQKLASLKNILQQMYKGYQVLDRGYSSVSDASQGNFSLHAAFLDGLLLVSPSVRKYPRIADILNDQATSVSEYKAAWSAFRQDPHFSPDETGYLMDVYNNLLSRSLKNLDDLSRVITAGQLRMNDAERLSAIDRIYSDSHGQLSFLRSFNGQAYRAALQRSKEADDRKTLRTLYQVTDQP